MNFNSKEKYTDSDTDLPFYITYTWAKRLTVPSI